MPTPRSKAAKLIWAPAARISAVVVRAFYNLCVSFLAFLKSEDLLDPILISLGLGFGFGLPIAVVWGLEVSASSSGVFVAFFGIFVGGAFTLVGAVIGGIVQTEPQIQEHHRLGVIAARARIKDAGRLEQLLRGIKTLLAGDARPEFWVDVLPTRGESLVEHFAPQVSWITLDNRKTDEALPIKLNDELENVRSSLETARANLDDYVTELRNWHVTRDEVQAELLLARPAELIEDVTDALRTLGKFRAACTAHASVS